MKFKATPRPRQHAIVVGGSLAGMFAARALADHYERVTVLDRDDPPPEPDHRSGVPQSHHAHGLLARGQQVIEELFPGIMSDLHGAGALQASLERLAITSPAGRLKPVNAGQTGTFVSRYLLEWTVRNHLQRNPKVHLVSNTEVVCPLASDDRKRVVGVMLRYRKGHTGPEQTYGDLVVDASGRNSEAPKWLVELGYDAPPEETVNSGVGYLSRFYQKPVGFASEWDGIIVNARPPENPRAGLVLPIEGNRWHVTLGNYAGYYPTAEATTDEGFLQFAGALPDPAIREALRSAEPLTPVRRYRTPTNRLRRFERLTKAPTGLIFTGDSVCAFNPIYGQGMTTSALDALALDESLRKDGPDFERAFQRRLARTVAAPWFIATSEDLRWEGVELKSSRWSVGTELLRSYVDALLHGARTDEILSRAYVRMLHMLDSPAALMRPVVVSRVVLNALRRRTNLQPPGHGAPHVTSADRQIAAPPEMESSADRKSEAAGTRR